MARLEFNVEHCKSCGYCVHYCPCNVLAIGNKINSKGYRYVVAAQEEKCISCAVCAIMCPDCVIEVSR